MSGVKGMRSRMSTSPDYANRVRARIRAGGIAKLLEKHVQGLREMSATQVTAALGVLRKVVPDISSIEHSGDVEHRYVATLPQAIEKSEEWVHKHSPEQAQTIQ